MNESSPDELMFSFRSVFSPLSSPTNMSQPDEQTKDPPQPAPSLQERLAPTQDYADKVFRKFHHHTISDLSAGESNESSPTTTISTVDDSSATEPSPGSSPESPPPTTFAVGMIRPRTSDDTRPFFELQKQPPPKKGRNLKNLAVNTSRGAAKASSTSSLPLSMANVGNTSTVASPSFVKPPSPPKRKPSNLGLTLLTPGISKLPPQEVKLAIPPTPGLGRPPALRHFQSSPSLPLLPGLDTLGNVGPQSRGVHNPLETIFSPIEGEQKQPQEEEEQNFDIPLSQEEKPEAYPDGPICVYEPHIDLYLEPTAEQARHYDVIMNVASEVRNPFMKKIVETTDEPEIRIDGGGGIQFAPKREGIPTPTTHESAHDSSPTTPKATPLQVTFPTDEELSTPKRDPEYIHIKWEHNSDIVPDLLRLVKLIDEKVMQGKRVLVHCQCGVSRSASLVVAYGLYKDPTLSVQAAYDAVKKRSKWIGPNMNLIMQLQEFRTSLMHGGLLPPNRGLTPITPSSAFTEWRSPFSSKPTDRNAPLSAGTAPLTKAQTAESLPILKAGPSSAPSGLQLPLPNRASGQRPRAISAVKPGAAYVNPSGRVIPVVPVLKVEEADAGNSVRKVEQTTTTEQNLEAAESNTPTNPTTSLKYEEFAMTPLQPSPDVDSADAFGLMSPTATEFSSSPFDRTALLAQLGMGPIGQQEDLAPRRSISLRSKPKAKESDDQSQQSGSKRLPKLRGKLSSPTIREQQQLQGLQANIEASLPHGSSSQPAATEDIDDALVSPRATEFTQNPFALSLAVPATPAALDEAPQSPDTDPRSPAQKGISPITRSIFDVL